MKFSTGNLPADSPLANILVVVVGTLLIAAFVVLGFFAFLAVASILLVLAAVLRIRLWWLKRFGKSQPMSNDSASNGVIEGEFSVVADDRDGE